MPAVLADLGSVKVISNVLDFRTIHARAECRNRPKPRLLPCRNRWHMTAKLLSRGSFPLPTLRAGGKMSGYRWTVGIDPGGLGFLALLAAFIAVTRISGAVIAGVQPEAWVLTAMMTAPFTVGAVSLFALVAALMETWLRRRRSEGPPSAPTVSTA